MNTFVPTAVVTTVYQCCSILYCTVPVSVAQSMRMSGVSEEASTSASASTSRPSASKVDQTRPDQSREGKVNIVPDFREGGGTTDGKRRTRRALEWGKGRVRVAQEKPHPPADQ